MSTLGNFLLSVGVRAPPRDSSCKRGKIKKGRKRAGVGGDEQKIDRVTKILNVREISHALK